MVAGVLCWYSCYFRSFAGLLRRFAPRMHGLMCHNVSEQVAGWILALSTL